MYKITKKRENIMHTVETTFAIYLKIIIILK